MGVPANIQGKDVGSNLAYMIKKSEKTTVPEFMKWLDNWKAAEIARLRAKNRDPILIMDKVACLETLCEGAHSLDEVLDNIEKSCLMMVMIRADAHFRALHHAKDFGAIIECFCYGIRLEIQHKKS